MAEAWMDELLARTRDAILATVRPDGSPQATPMWYHWDGDLVRMSTTTSTRKLRDIRRDPRISVCVNDQVAGMYVTLSGPAEVVEGDRELVRAETWPLLLRYLHPDEATARWQRIDANGDRVVIRMRPTRIFGRHGVR